MTNNRNLNPQAAAALEAHRKGDGKFGTQNHTTPDVTLPGGHHPTLTELGITPADLEHTVEQAFVTLLWQSTEVENYEAGIVYNPDTGEDEDTGEPQDALTIYDFDDDTREFMEAELVEFIAANPDLVKEALNRPEYAATDGTGHLGAFAHDFVLTRNGHGAGFWDRDALQADDLGKKLGDAVSARSEMDVEVYDGKVGVMSAGYRSTMKAEAAAHLRAAINAGRHDESYGDDLRQLAPHAHWYKDLSYTDRKKLAAL